MTRKLLHSGAIAAAAAVQELSPPLPLLLPPPASPLDHHDHKLLAISLAALFVLACSCFGGYTWNRRRSSDDVVRPSANIPPNVEKQFWEQLRAIPVVVYSGAPAGTGEAECCAICLADLVAEEEVRVLPKCNHYYHKACIDAWLCRRSTWCPVCRDVVIVIPAKEEIL